MKPFKNNRKSIDDPIMCVIMFLLILGLLLLVANLKDYYIWQIVYGYLFFLGWFSWTFIEYMFHRFAWHSKRTNNADFHSVVFNHSYHHQHPNDIKISKLTRFLLAAGSLILVFISIWIHNYFTIVVGFVCGFTIYNFTHWLLHQKVTQKIFPKKVRYHIHHHCKHPDKCFGITVTWWDDIFGTVPVKKEISRKVIDFYFGEKIIKPVASIKKGVFILMILLPSHFYSHAQDKSLHYDVTRNGNVIGFVNVTEKTKELATVFSLESDVKTRFIFSYSNYITESVIFENGLMVAARYYQKENGKKTSRVITSDGNYFKTISEGQTDSEAFVPVHNNYLQLFFYRPENTLRVYSNHYEKFLEIKKVAENKYRLTLPDGNCNYYHYKNGVCDRVDIERTFFTIHFVLRKNQ